MRGALTFIIFMTFLWSTDAGASAQSAVRFEKTPLSLDESFAAVRQDVQNQLLNAPEASYAYLTHWIRIYNQSKTGANVFSFEQKIDLSQARRETMQFQLNKQIGSQMDFQSYRPNGGILHLSVSRRPHGFDQNPRPTSRV